MANRRHSARHVKRRRSYNVREAAKATGATPGTVRHWHKNGLEAVVGVYPPIFRGVDIIDFFKRREDDRKRPCGPASFRLKHVDLKAQTVFQDGREVRTKARKTFVSTFFPVGPEPLAIVADYIAMLKGELGFGPDDPLFPSTQMGRGADRGFVVQGLSRKPWSGAAPIRQIFREAFAAAGLPYANPHSFRDTLALHGDSLNLTREEEKAYSQNFGHESVWTTRESYGTLPAHRQAEIMRRLVEPRLAMLPPGLDIAALKAFVRSLETIDGG